MIRIILKFLVYGFAVVGVLASLAVLHDELYPHGLRPVSEQVTP